MAGYVELASDHAFSAFLGGLTPGRVRRDLERNFSKQEKKQQLFLRQKAALERQVAVDRLAKFLGPAGVAGVSERKDKQQ